MPHTQSKYREIVSDFAEAIDNKKTATAAEPSKTIIHFRNEMVNQIQRDIVNVPVELLRFRKDNGRIASDVLDYEKTHGPLNEQEENHQEILRGFLEKKDPEKREALFNSIRHSEQIEPAIITCDGFLINGNRRKMVIDQLKRKGGDKFKYMKVVILPGEKDEGGAPTLLNIEEIENRYQLQQDGRSEYYGLDKALSIRRKVKAGMSLEAQVADDPQYASEDDKQKKKAVNKIKKEYLKPLECVDRYLRQFERDGQYHTISTGMGDREGRWEAFKDYSRQYESKFLKDAYLIENNIEEVEIGDIEETAFNLIRLRNIPDAPKVHAIMRDLAKYCAVPGSKKEILNISRKVEPLQDDELFDNGDPNKPLSRREVDAKWSAKNKQHITYHLKRATKIYDDRKEKETPLGLLDAALKKLQHQKMDLKTITIGDFDAARNLITNISQVVKELDNKLFEQQKKLKKLTEK